MSIVKNCIYLIINYLKEIILIQCLNSHNCMNIQKIEIYQPENLDN